MNKVKVGAVVGAAVVLSFPLAAHASTSTTTPLPTTSSLTTSSLTTTSATTSVQSTATAVTAPVTQTLAPKATTSDTSSTMTTPAPAGTADAYAAQVAGVIAVSHTSASASGSGTSSTANPLEIGGNPPASQFGGTQNGPGSSGTALLDTGPSNQFRLALAPWSAVDTQDGGQNTASALSDIVLLDLGDQTSTQSASVRVLQSQSNATWNSSSSSGSSSSDGAIIKAGGPNGLNIDLLHAETSSDGTGNSYLVSINGTQIGTSGQVNGKCAISIPGLLSLNCLTASGGTANSITSAAAGVAEVVLGTPPAGLDIGLIQSKSSAGPAGSPSVISDNGNQQGGSSGGPTGTSGTAPAAGGSGSLAFTGFDGLALALAGLLLAAVGGLLVWTTRRMRTQLA